MEIQYEIDEDVVVEAVEKLCSEWSIYENHFERIRPLQLARSLARQLVETV
jgi:hypothetical protein